MFCSLQYSRKFYVNTIRLEALAKKVARHKISRQNDLKTHLQESPQRDNQPPKHKGKGKDYELNRLNTDDLLGNLDLLANIQAECKKRTHLRTILPSEEWSKNRQKNHIIQELKGCINSATVTLSMLQLPLSIGDLVLVLKLSTKLHLVVELPLDLNSNTYTFLSEDGEIIYGPRSCIHLRVPGVIPANLIKSLDLIMMETKHPGIAPSGMPDSTFSRDTQAGFLKRKKSTNDRNKAEIQEVNELANEANFYNVGDDLLVAQASSEFLTDTDVNTFIVPLSARDIYASQLRELSIKSFGLIPQILKKLDDLYKVYELSQSYEIMSSKISLSILELYRSILLPESIPSTKGSQIKFKGHKQKVWRHKKNPIASIPITDYIALLLSLKRSNRTWRVDTQKSNSMPVSISLRPTLDFLESEHVKSFLSDEVLLEFADFYVNYMKHRKSSNIPDSSWLIIKIFQNFVADGCAHDLVIASLVSTLVKKIDDSMRKRGLLQWTLVYEPRSRAYEILSSLDENNLRDPTIWLKSSTVPYSKTSLDSDLLADYQAFIDFSLKSEKSISKMKLNKEFYTDDALKEIRTDFGNTPVYCIDSATAHEIDDGISIDNDHCNYVITVHIANPTSYVRPKSIITQFAFGLGGTNYLPEKPTTMLPQALSKLCGLEQPSKEQQKKRTLAIEYKLDKKLVTEYFEKIRKTGNTEVSDELAEKVAQCIQETVEIKACYASLFPVGFTYEYVNTILNNEDKIEGFKNNLLNSASHEQNLFQLYHISTILKHIRMKSGNGMELNTSPTNVHVDFEENYALKTMSEIKDGWSIPLHESNQGITPVVSLTRSSDQASVSKSQQLVSNFMIAANFAGAHFSRKFDIPIIYKAQSLNISEKTQNSIKELNRQLYASGELHNFEDMSAIISVLTSANFTTTPASHDSFGLGLYLNFTSPLRRYVDMINHWNLQVYLLNQAGIKRHYIPQLEIIASHLQACEFLNKRTQRFANRFWICKFLQRYFELKEQGLIKNPITFSFFLSGDVKYGEVKASILEFTGVYASIAQNEFLAQELAVHRVKAGKIIRVKHFIVNSLDFIRGELRVELLGEE